MVKFLITRPVAVTMTFLALILLGITASRKLPVSLMPDIDIPEITITVSRHDVSAREIENTIVSILRRNLLQVQDIDNMESESRNGSAVIRLTFRFGTDINLAFMEVNEKVDGAMNYLPDDLERPRIIKASATDIPVFLFNVTLKDSLYAEEKFVELSEFVETVIKKRIEQLPDIGFADITGQTDNEIFISPDEKKMINLGLTDNDIIQAVKLNNLKTGSILVKDGKYLFNLEFSSYLGNLNDVRDIYLKSGNRLFKLRDIAEVGQRLKSPRGEYYSNGKRAVCMAIIKESSAKMSSLETNMYELTGEFRKEYPQLDFEISQDQTRLLDYSIKNLKQSLILGGILAFLLMFIFLKDGKSPLIIGLSIPTTLVISLLFFYLFNISVNIVSLAGLILGIGMMIDNSIVVIENITQWIEKGLSLKDACSRGTNEIITPLISSVLVTCAVFIPLIFLSGISGALFYDQAIAIVIGQGVSLLVGITFLPTIYYLMYKHSGTGNLTRIVKKIRLRDIEGSYEGTMRFFFKYRIAALISFSFTIIIMIILFRTMEKEKFPEVRQDELVLSVDWNENIEIGESISRIKQLIRLNHDLIQQTNSFIGEQQFLFIRDYDQAYTQAKVYLKAKNYELKDELSSKCYKYLKGNYPEATVMVESQKNIFERIFSASETPLVAELSLKGESKIPSEDQVNAAIQRIEKNWPDAGISSPPTESRILLNIDPDKLLLYDINPETLYGTLRKSLNQDFIGILRTSNVLMPIVLSEKENQISDIIYEGKVLNKTNSLIPIKEVVKIQRINGFKTIKGGMTGEYVPVNMNIETNNLPLFKAELEDVITSSDSNLSVGFSGALITGQNMFKELLVILFVAILLLYFILAAQFESLTQPFIVLLEIPIDIAGALLLVKLFGGTINIMTMIGLVVMSGVIINDSILKVDTINNLRREGLMLKDAIFTGGTRRLKPIIMVAMASILSTLPIVFSKGIGSDLQLPMALALIGGMSLGTIVSLYFVPLAYWYMYRNSEIKA